jgi:hypothetical protein
MRNKMSDQPNHNQHPAPVHPRLLRPQHHQHLLQEVFLHVYPISKLYTDDTGQFPTQACLGNQYVKIAYHTDGNLILQQAFQTKSDKHHIPVFNTIMAQLAACGLSVDLNIRDNEASTDFK